MASTTGALIGQSYALVADDIRQFLEQLALHPAHIAGVSDMGIVALHIGMTRPDLARTLICQGVGPLRENAARVRTLA